MKIFLSPSLLSPSFLSSSLLSPSLQCHYCKACLDNLFPSFPQFYPPSSPLPFLLSLSPSHVVVLLHSLMTHLCQPLRLWVHRPYDEGEGMERLAEEE